VQKDMLISFEIEPICKVVCAAVECKNNLARFYIGGYCNLKYISMSENGQCLQFDQKEQSKDEV
jgi:hypothetical protein